MSLHPLIAIAKNTFLEAIRDRILYAFVLFAFVLTLAGVLLGSLSIGQDIRVLEDLGLAVISFIGGIIGIFSGTNLVYKEIDKRTIYLIFTKPVSRWQFVLGKYLGLSACVLTVLVFMGAFLAGLIAVLSDSHSITPYILQSLALIYLELLFVIAIATFFSTFTTPTLSVLFTLSLWLISHAGQALKEMGRLSQNDNIANLFNAIYWILPDLASLTQFRQDLLYRQPSAEAITFLTTYLLTWVVLLLSFATFITERREYP